MNWPLAVAATGVSATVAQVIIVAAVPWRTRGSNQRHDLTDTCRHCQAITTQTVTTIGSGWARRSAQRCLTCRHIAFDTRYRAVRTLARCDFYSSIALLALALMSLDSPVLH